jgi:hypothetical protein
LAALPGLNPRWLGKNHVNEREVVMATNVDRSSSTGIGIGGVLVIAGIVVAIFWSVLLGLIIAGVGLIAFGGFVKGRWY